MTMSTGNASSPTNVQDKGHQEELLLARAQACDASSAFDDIYLDFIRRGVLHCEHLWDGISCWPPTPANATAWIRCPDYFHNFDPAEFASRNCTSIGTWWMRPDGRQWADYGPCKKPLNMTMPAREPDECELSLNATLGYNTSTWTPERHALYTIMAPYMSTLSVIGYSVSLVSLVLAISILISVKRLYCPRNTLHINLFVAFAIHALATISSRNPILDDYEGGHAVHHTDVANMQANDIACRWQTAFFHYAIMANYFWIFIEGLYLNNVISFSVFTDHSKMIWFHIAGGWLPPVFFVGLWAGLRLEYDNCFCWKVNNARYSGLFWILRGPITATIIMNFIFFINITRLIFIKFRTQTTLREQQANTASGRLKYRRLAKSTLVLLAVYGIHFFILLVIEEVNMNIYLDVVLLMIDLAFTSSQGFIAALLLCFANADVRSEVCRMRLYLSNSPLGRTGSRLSERIRRISEMERTSESLKMHSTLPARKVHRNGPYAAMTKTQTLSIPTTQPQPASCESLYLQTADNSDEENTAK
ncbi:secretin receptor-like [Paramacrobiotus metropolitanus]|uniref:secretin receptor-like n=1 Tax=Paramacrobiotus metropolitanus TaxID=2943436 RepID=UPI0024464DEA|nr:secretin receptor-like [Paramacrobiotus metropolitanus]